MILIGGWRSRGQRWALIGRAVITSLTARQHQPAHCFTPTPGQDALCPHLNFIIIIISVSLIVVVVIIIMLNLNFKILLTKPGFRISTKTQLAWDGEEVAGVGEGEEGGLVGSAELGDPDLAGGPVLPMKL